MSECIVDYFMLLNLPIKLPIDLTLLNQHYQTALRYYHPDNFVNDTAQKKQWSVQQSANINTAYRVLKDPLLSIEYFLTLQGVTIKENETINDSAFLMGQLLLREQFDEIINLSDASQREQQLSVMSQQLKAERNRYYQQVLMHLAQSQWLQAGDIVKKLHFFDKLLQQIMVLNDEK